MFNMGMVSRGTRVAAIIGVALTMAACAGTGHDGLSGQNGNVRPGTGQDFVVNVGDRVFFAEDQSTLSPEARDTLSKQAQWLKQYGNYSITEEGHADERGTRQYNIALGARRANAARDYLVSQGIDPSRIHVISYGKERPVAVCDNESCYSQNRRAVTVLNGAGS